MLITVAHSAKQVSVSCWLFKPYLPSRNGNAANDGNQKKTREEGGMRGRGVPALFPAIEECPMTRAVSVGAIVRNAASVGYVWMAALESD